MLRLRALGPAMLGVLLATPGSASACDLTGHWRSTLGALDLLQRAHQPVAAPTVGGLEENAVSAPSEAQLLLSGGFDSAKGRGQLAGLLDGTSLTLRWAMPDSFAAPDDAGDVEASVSADCDSIEGRLRKGYDGTFDQSFVARRVAATAGEAAVGYAEAKAALEARLAASRLQQAATDRSLFEVAALAERLGPDPDAILAFVRDAIADEPYQGVLRGAEGALIAKAGNAADKALLLAALLGAQGHAVRFAHARLSPDRGAPLLTVTPATTALSDRTPAPPQSLLQAYGVTPEALEEARRLESAASLDLLDKVTAEAAGELAFLEGLLAEAAYPVPVDPVSELLEAAADHWWVQLETAEGWRDLDPTPVGAGGALAAEETLPLLPQELYHRVEIMVFIERSDGTALARERVGGWSLAVADVMRAGLPSFRLMNLPSGGETLTEEWGVDALRKAAQEMTVDWYLASESFQPVLLLSNGETQLGAAFDLAGDVLPEDWQLRLAHNVQKTLGGGLEASGNVLENLMTGGAPPVQRRLTAVWYEFRLIAPDGSSQSHLRTVVDRLGPSRRVAGVVALPDDAMSDDAVKLLLGTASDLLITGGLISADFALWRMGETFLANAPFLENLLEARFGRRSFSPALIADALRYPNELLVFDTFRQSIAGRIATNDGVSLVQSHPNLLMLQRGVQRDAEGVLKAVHRFDLIDVELSVASSSDRAEAARLQRRYGVEVTVLERLLLPLLLARECPGCSFAPGIGTSVVFDRARQEGIGFAVLAPGDGTKLAELELRDDTKAYVAGELAGGRWIVMPRRPVQLAEDQMLGWWRIDPASGATLGMMQSGAGEGVTEYIVVLSFILFGGNFLAVGSTIVMSPFDGKSQGFFGTLSCAFVAALCPHLFGFNVPISPTAENLSCRVDSLIAGVDCATIKGSAPRPANELSPY